MKPFEHIVIHYDEIGLKSSNRRQFESLLMSNMSRKLGEAVMSVRKESGQQVLTLNPGCDREAVCTTLARIPGIAYFSPAWCAASKPESIIETGVALMREQTFRTFGVITKRREKDNPLRSDAVNKALGSALLEAFPDAKVNLNDPDIWLKVEITNARTYLSVSRHEGVGGLPTSPHQPVIALISGGLDSPVAAYQMMKRGCRVILVHFQNENHMTASVEDKIYRLAGQLAHFQMKTTLHIIPFGDLQREIIKAVPSDQRMLFYRHIMLKASARLAAAYRARLLVTGDCLSQVASQTIDNLASIYQLSELPVLAPLIGHDKKEITEIARRIGTYDISALPYDDCCSLFVPRHPQLRASADAVRSTSDELDLDAQIAQALNQKRSHVFQADAAPRVQA